MAKNFNFKPATPPPSQGAASAELAKMLGVPAVSSSAAVRQIQMIKIEFLDTHPLQHCYSMDAEELDWLAENVRQNGVMEPIHVQKKENGRYTIIAGHRRTEASRRAGLTEIPAIVEHLDEAIDLARELGEEGGACVLSPAAASYGIFKNFGERGAYFKQYIFGQDSR